MYNIFTPEEANKSVTYGELLTIFQPVLEEVAKHTMGYADTLQEHIFKVISSIIIGVTYAITDEIHQGFTPGRAPSVTDVCIDSMGVLTGIFILITLIVFVESIVNWLKR